MKKTFTSKALIVTFKKTQDFLPFFKTLSLFSRLFPSVGNCWANFQDFFNNLRLWMNPVYIHFPKFKDTQADHV